MAEPIRPTTMVAWKLAVRPGQLVWLTLALGLLLAVVVVDRGSLGQILGQFATTDWRLGAAGLVLMAVVDLAKTWRWQVLYGGLRPTYQRVLQAQVVGQAANTLVPLRFGEVCR